MTDDPTPIGQTPDWQEWTIACLDRLCVNCPCGESLEHAYHWGTDDWDATTSADDR